MSISSELEKLTALRDRGDLSPEEFRKAKALLLSGEGEAVPPPVPVGGSDAPGKKRKEAKTQLAVAICATVAAVLSGVSAAISPSPLKFVIVFFWIIAAGLGWMGYGKLKG